MLVSRKKYKKQWYEANKTRENKRSRDYYEANKERIAEQTKRKNQEIKKAVMSYYSEGFPKCKCCGEFGLDFLSIDHVNGGGTQHRRLVAGTVLYRWLIKNNFPDGYQVLCFNCNCAKGLKQNNNVCPHERMRDAS